jgi:hypothetical protein
MDNATRVSAEPERIESDAISRTRRIHRRRRRAHRHDHRHAIYRRREERRDWRGGRRRPWNRPVDSRTAMQRTGSVLNFRLDQVS